MVVMKAMGMQSDQEVVQMIGRDPRYGSLLLPSIEVILIDLFWTSYFMQVLRASFKVIKLR